MNSKIKLILAFITALIFLGLMWSALSIYKYLTPKRDAFFQSVEKSAQFYNEETLKSKLDKALDNFYTVANKDKTKNKKDRESFKINNKYFENLLKSSVETCNDNCFGKEYKNLADEKIPNIYDKKNFSFKIKDASYTFNISNSACMLENSTTSHICGFGYIDINSSTEPNKLGYDVFNVSLFADNKGSFFFAPTNTIEIAKIRCTVDNGYDCISFALNKDLSYMKKLDASKSAYKISEKPYFVTIFLATFVARSRSFEAPVQMSSRKSSSATRPPRSITIDSRIFVLDMCESSVVGLVTVRPAAIPRWITVTW